ncbi:hypothetical protein LDENG_00294120 [Lucifuga dentata]|nr:hypothetical protein LDENG_00294120 [Lucifuga dentata]
MSLMKLCAPQNILSRCVSHTFIQTGCFSAFLMRTHTHQFGQASLVHTHTPQLNSNRTSVVRCGHQKYERLYPVLLVRPDGSTINVRYKEPRRILMVGVVSLIYSTSI